MKKLSLKTKITVLSAVIVISATTAVFAHGGAMGVVKERMDLMSAIGKNMKSVASMVKGDAKFDPTAIEASAKSMAEHSTKINDLFPKGSLEKPTEALPSIWEDWGRFAQLSKDLETETNKLAEIATSGDKRAIIMQFAQTGKVCSTCHTNFRIKKD
ncbi:c-type cytochrome [Terasakiella pusilla]|jgi:cytochrome c556|uniref:c-type cytochrome n=1 Tax=Terasakiella pusilla TaxID=64973 RepID=UPI003AA86CFA